MQAAVLKPYRVFRSLFFDPLPMLRKWVCLPIFARNLASYHRLGRDHAFPVSFKDLFYTSHDRLNTAGTAKGHYFLQDLWAARKVYESLPTVHVDVASRIDGFVSNVLSFCPVKYVDIRPLDAKVPGLEFCEGTIQSLPFETNSVDSLSCLHVIEHIGLGRYGDPIDPEGHVSAAAELVRVLRPGGTLLIGTPVGRQRLCFDAHRVFAPEAILALFKGAELVQFSLIDDNGLEVQEDAALETAGKCNYGCGLFQFTKPHAPI